MGLAHAERGKKLVERNESGDSNGAEYGEGDSENKSGIASGA